MNKKKNIVANILLLTYIMVLLHNFFPHHHHGNSGSENCHIENHDDENHSHDNSAVYSFFNCHEEGSHDEKSVICYFSDSFSKSNISSDFISACNLFGVRFFANITTLQFEYNQLKLILHSYHSLPSRAPPVV